MADWIDTNEAHQLSGYSIQHLRYLLRKNKILGQKKAGGYWIDKTSLKTYLASVNESSDKRHGPQSNPNTPTGS